MSARIPARTRHGFTLIELIVTMVMFSIVGTAIVKVLNGQQRFSRAAAEVGAVRTQMQAATLVLPSEFRMLSPIDHDIIAMDSSSVTILSTIATGVVCIRAGQVITLEPDGSLAGMISAPAIGDSVFIWDDLGSQKEDDTWRSKSAGNPAYAVTGVAAGTCAAPLTGAATATYDLTISAATMLQDNIARGAPLVITRQVQYGLYQGSDNNWYLGFREAGAAAYDYVAGPFRNAADRGLQLAYFNSSDVELTGAAGYAKRDSVARVEITTRVKSNAPISMSGVTAAKQFYDSLKVGVALRNRVDY